MRQQESTIDGSFLTMIEYLKLWSLTMWNDKEQKDKKNTKLKEQAVVFRTVKILKTLNSQSQDLAVTDKVLKS